MGARRGKDKGGEREGTRLQIKSAIHEIKLALTDGSRHTLGRDSAVQSGVTKGHHSLGHCSWASRRPREILGFLQSLFFGKEGGEALCLIQTSKARAVAAQLAKPTCQPPPPAHCSCSGSRGDERGGGGCGGRMLEGRDKPSPERALSEAFVRVSSLYPGSNASIVSKNQL